MKMGKYVILTVIFTVLALLLGACTGPPAGAPAANTGTILVHVTDALPQGVTAVEIKASNVEAHMAGAAEENGLPF